MSIVAALRRTRARSGRSLSAVATQAGLTESNLSTIEHDRRSPRADTIDRLAAALHITLVPTATGGRNTVAEAGEHVARAIANGDTERAYRSVVQLANDLASASPFLRLLLGAEAPPPIDPGWDAFLAAVTEWRLQQAGLPAPDWVLDSIDANAAAWSPPTAVLPARENHVPAAFRRRGVLVEEDEFASA